MLLKCYSLKIILKDQGNRVIDPIVSTSEQEEEERRRQAEQQQQARGSTGGQE